MSYILEALKKAQAERQLGSTPGIHDALAPAPVAQAGPGRMRLWLALGGAVLLVGAGMAAMRLMVRADQPMAALPPQPALLETAPAAPLAVAPAPSPVRHAPAPAVQVAQLPPVAGPLPAAPPPPAPAAPPQPQTQAEAHISADESLPTLAGLDPALASGIPRVTLAGYIYSPVPSERLVLVDKDLRREGEEVAPGLVLEKLLPSGAVMNYRGTRFRMPY